MPSITRFPAPPLNAYIDRIYYLYGQMPYSREKILPAPWLDFKVNFGGALTVYKADEDAPIAICDDSWSVGLWNACHVVDWPDDLELLGVFFKPGGAYPFLQIPTCELHNQVVSLDAIWGTSAAEIRDRLHSEPTLETRLDLLEQLLVERLHEPPPGYPIVQYALTQIATHHGTLSIQTLSADIGISQNHLGNLFKALVGGTPKEVARLYRFDHVVNVINVVNGIDPLQPVDWTEVAHQALYYDQSHFNKDFAAFTGHNPTDYLRLRRKVYTENPDHAYYLRELPAD